MSELVESNAELIERYKRVGEMVRNAENKLRKMKPGGAKHRHALWCGSISFALMQIKSKMEERGLKCRDTK
jgi:hypothetical protein